jgi:hypothetical protein
MDETLAWVRAAKSVYLRFDGFSALAPLVPAPQGDGLAAEAFALMQTPDLYWFHDTMAALAPHLPDRFFEPAVAAIEKLSDARTQGAAIEALAPRVPGPLLQRMLKVAVTFPNRILRPWPETARAIAAILSVVPPETARPIIEAVVDDVKGKEKDLERAETLAVIVPKLARPEVEAVLADLEQNHFPLCQAPTLIALARHLPGDLVPRARRAARAISEPEPRAKALAALLPLDPTSGLDEAVTAALDVEQWVRAGPRPLVDVAPWWAKAPVPDAQALWTTMMRRGARRRRDDLLSALKNLTPVLVTLGDGPACGEAFGAVQAVGRWWP